MHKIYECALHPYWISRGQPKDIMYNSERSQICEDCTPLILAPENLIKHTIVAIDKRTGRTRTFVFEGELFNEGLLVEEMM